MRYNPYKRLADRETLERIERWPNLMKRFNCVRIYSAEWHAFWRNSGQGYTENATDSAIWTIEAAFSRTRGCGPEKRIQFVAATN